MKSKYFLNKVVNVCGKVVGERQEQLSQLYERRVVRKARVGRQMTTAMFFEF